jgi:hypothetical protein
MDPFLCMIHKLHRRSLRQVASICHAAREKAAALGGTR